MNLSQKMRKIVTTSQMVMCNKLNKMMGICAIKGC